MQAGEGVLELRPGRVRAFLIATQHAVLLVGLPIALLGIDSATGGRGRRICVLAEFLSCVELGPRPGFRIFRSRSCTELIPCHHLGLSGGIAVALGGAEILLLVLAVLGGGRVLGRVARGRGTKPVLMRHQAVLLGRALALVRRVLVR